MPSTLYEEKAQAAIEYILAAAAGIIVVAVIVFATRML